MRLLLVLFIVPSAALSQEARYFTRHFQKMTDEVTPQQRKYTIDGNAVIIEDYDDGTIKQKGTLYGVTNLDEINEFAWYCISRGNEINYKSYFKNLTATFEFYHKEKPTNRIVVTNNRVRFAQVWNKNGDEILANGTGQSRELSPSGTEENFESYKDSVQIDSYLIRHEKQDTIHFAYDKIASPKNGLQNFYTDLVGALKYPGIARLAGKEGRVYVEFVVDQQGKLTEFRPLTNEGYHFETKTVKRLERFPNWNPAIQDGKPVKTKFVLPVVFKFAD